MPRDFCKRVIERNLVWRVRSHDEVPLCRPCLQMERDSPVDSRVTSVGEIAIVLANSPRAPDVALGLRSYRMNSAWCRACIFCPTRQQADTGAISADVLWIPPFILKLLQRLVDSTSKQIKIGGVPHDTVTRTVNSGLNRRQFMLPSGKQVYRQIGRRNRCSQD